ncbi:MAG: hypothetical protein KY452_01235 [Actinobacteria bacterium]|nr:hypothetical protein [Actinomycetota bacterium]
MIQTYLQPLDEATRLQFAGTWEGGAHDVGSPWSVGLGSPLLIPEEPWQRAEREQHAIYG